MLAMQPKRRPAKTVGPSRRPSQASAHKVLWDDGVSRRRILQAGLGLLALPATQILQACATTPITGRSQLRLISEEEEAKLGVTAFQQLRDEEVKKGRLLTEREDPAAHALVKRVSERVIAASGLGNAYKWDYMLLNAPETVNAAAIAGGRIIVYTGILPVSKTDAGLATIMGHEVGHVMAHHTAERFSQDQLVNVAGAVAGASGGGNLATLAVLGARAGRLPASVQPGAGERGRLHRRPAHGQGRLRSSRIRRAVAAHEPGRRKQGTGVPFHAPQPGHPDHPAPELDAPSVAVLPEPDPSAPEHPLGEPRNPSSRALEISRYKASVSRVTASLGTLSECRRVHLDGSFSSRLALARGLGHDTAKQRLKLGGTAGRTGRLFLSSLANRHGHREFLLALGDTETRRLAWTSSSPTPAFDGGGPAHGQSPHTM